MSERRSHPTPFSNALLGAFVGAIMGLAGCTGGAQTPPPESLQNVDSSAPPAERLTTHLENLASTLASSKGDCEQLAAQLYGWTKARQADFPELARDTAANQLEQSAYDAYRGRIQGAVSTVLDAVAACPNHAGAQAAFTEFDVLLDPPE